MSKTYSHSEVMDLIHKCKESERLIWREKLEEKNEQIGELHQTMRTIFVMIDPNFQNPEEIKKAKKAKRKAEVRAIMKKKRLEEPERMNSDALAKVRAEWMTKNSK